MQRNDTIDSSKQRRVGGRDQNSGQQDPVQHFVLTSQLQALAGQGRLSLIPGLTNTASPASTSPGTQVTPPVTLSTPLQHQTAVVVTSQDLGRLFTAATVSGTSTTQTCSPVISAQTLQRQFSGQGIVGVLSPGRQQGTAALVARSIPAGTTELQIAQPLTLVTTSASVTTGNLGIVSGGTVHHHGQSPSRGAQPTPRPNLQQTSFKMNTQTNPQQQSPRASVTVAGSTGGNLAAAAAGKVLQETKPAIAPSGLSLTFPNLTALANQSAMGPSPKKKIKIEEKAPATQEIANNRKLILDHKYKEMLEIKENYIEYLTELFFLQNGGNLMDYFAWKKRPTPQLVHFLKSGNLDSDEEEDHGQERKINNEVKVITCSGSNVPLATPVAIATTLPPSVAALNQQATTTGFETRRPGGRHGMVFGHVQPVIAACASSSSVGSGVIPSQVTSSFSISSTSLIQSTVMSSAQTNTVTNQRPSTCVSSSSVTTVTTATTSVSMPQLQSQLAKVITESKPLSVHTGHVTKSTMSPPTSSQSSPALRTPKTPPTSPGGTLRAHTRQGQISAVYDGAIGSQEAIVERAKQEAQVMQRVAELRKEGLWSSRRLPKVQEPPRNKGHWDYLLEEMQWLAADFQQERKWKKAAARKVAKMVSKYFQELEQKEMRAEKEEGQKLKRIAGQIAKQIREFWTNIEKVVQYKHQTRMEEKRKKALDIHLNFIVDQTEKYSTWLTEGLKKGKGGSSVATTPDQSIDGGDDEFEPEEDDADDEETIEKEEEDLDDESTKAELDALQKEGEVPIEELLQSLPKEVLDKPARLDDEEEQDDNDKDGDHDKEFTASEDEEVDVEETIEEQEKEEKKMDYSTELKDLENEGEMDIEELYKKYAGAYDSDFEMPESSGTEDDDDDDESTDDDDEEEDEEDEEEEIVDKDVGLEFLMDTENTSQETKTSSEYEEKGPGKEITDIAAEAQSLQPKGYTLQTTEVKTQVPFLLRGTLREYQHVGLDWLATMYEKRLNGILADEMGLGKTIQTIALLAHLACDKGIWGPHLIVVPTSVMLNWEMEIKKWCPAFKILTYYGNQKERKLKRQGWTKTNAFHVCITSYKLVIQDHQSFRRKKWKYFILDEAQNIKNFKSQRWQTLLNFSSQRRLLLTGTPLQNSLMELWSLMHFLMPNVFQSHREFKEWFANPLTGMIEGSHEYNESLIRRLHKVLRPFLLRRLKADVEKQMPKKYEHVVMCHLSKRQRFLYDEFMSQTKTKETLAAGHFMSVINILMQLRKVCNHPSLFDPRPIISPFQTEGIVYHTASLALDAVKYDPFKNIDIHSLYPSLADMELDLPAFIAHRVKRLQTPRKLIEEIDDQPEPEPRPQPGKLKPVTFRSVSPMIQSGRSTPVITTSDSNVSSSATTTVQSTVSSRQPTTTVASSVSQPISTVSVTTTSSVTTQPVHTTLQAKVVPQGSQSSQQVTTSQPITVQIQHTEQGARLMIPAGQLSQLPAGFIQIVQTSMGQQIIATSNPMTTSTQQRVSSPLGTAVSPAVSVTTSSTTLVNGLPTITTVATMSPTTTVTSVTTQVRTTPTVQLPTTTTAATAQKPVMRVSPLVSESGSTFGVTSPVTKVGQVSTTMSTTSVRMSVGEENKHVTRSVSQRETAKVQKKSELYLDSVCLRRQQQRKEKLEYIARINKLHCERKPVYGQDLCLTVNVLKDMECTRTKDNTWHGIGYVHCYNVHAWKNPHHPDCFWHQTKVLSNLVHTPIQYLNELEDILSRFVFATPPVTSPRIQMHVSHPPPSQLIEDRQRDFLMQTEVSPKASCLHKISTNRIVQFPELRLIQYDCGKLQVLDILLRRLKSEQHRVLIFTQMTKMLDVLEAFLNYHGHRYLRLDGTTRVEQRQMLMDRFNADKRIFCFILSTRSGGIGVNLTGADTVVFYDSDWNPTMDAQAQDRCHRIGQTRDVHIYRLISERTVEENILKKANQKRMLGDMAIEGGNFTTAFFKEQTIKELFSEPSGLDSLVKQKQVEDQNKDIKVKKEVEEVVKKTSEKIKVEKEESPPPVVQKSETNIVAQFEQALEKAEDETDVVAANLVKAEQKAELAEFDEDIPWDEREAERRKEEEEISRAEQELAMLEKELSPVERYAVVFMEQEMDPSDELQMAEEDIESSKKDWELARLKALKEEEERRLEIEEDEMLYTYSRDDAYNQVKKKSKKGKPYIGCSGLIPTVSLSPPRAVAPGRRKSTGKATPANKIQSASKYNNKTPKNSTGARGRGGKTPTIDVEYNSDDYVDSGNENMTSSDDEKQVKAQPKAANRKKVVKNVTKSESESTKNVLKREKVQQKTLDKPVVTKAAANIMKKVRNKVIKVCDITVPASPVKDQVEDHNPAISLPVSVDVTSPPSKLTQRQARQALQKQLKGVKAAALLKQQQIVPSPSQSPKAGIPSTVVSAPLSIPSLQARKQAQVLTVQQMAAQQGLPQVAASPVVNISTSQANSDIQHVINTTQGKVSIAATTPQPQLLTPSQLQHLKQIISQAHHNMQQQQSTPPASGNKISLKTIPQPVFSAQQAILQVPQPIPQVITPTQQHQTYQVVHQTQGGTIRQVIPQAQGSQPVQVLKQATHTIPAGPQVLAQSGQQSLQIVSQVQQIPIGSSTMAPGIQQLVAGPSNSSQPTLSFIKVSGNSNVPPQPVIQYCVNSVGSPQGVRIQSPQITGTAPQQGVVLLQLAGGKAVPVSMAGSPVGLPVARMMGNKAVLQGQVPRIRQVLPQSATVIAQQPQVIAQNQMPGNPVSPSPQAPRLSMPTSRFQIPNHTPKTKAIPRVPVPAIINAPFTLVTAAEQPVVNKSAVAPVALLGARKVQNTINNSPKENSNPVPWSNPNLVIRTRRAAMQEQNDKGEAEILTTLNDISTPHISLDTIPIPVQETLSMDQAQNSQFISLIKANAMPVVPVGANVTIGMQGSPQKKETILTIPQPHLTHFHTVPVPTENGGNQISLSENG